MVSPTASDLLAAGAPRSWAPAAADDAKRPRARERVRAHLLRGRWRGHGAWSLYMVFSGRLLKPGGEAPEDPRSSRSPPGSSGRSSPGCVAVRGFVYLVGLGARRRGGVHAAGRRRGSAPLRRLFVLQFGVLVGGLIVYWPLDSSSAGAGRPGPRSRRRRDVVLAVLERLRMARIKRRRRGGRARAWPARGARSGHSRRAPPPQAAIVRRPAQASRPRGGAWPARRQDRRRRLTFGTAVLPRVLRRGLRLAVTRADRIRRLLARAAVSQGGCRS